MLALINKLMRYPNKIPKDKLIHTLSGVVFMAIALSAVPISIAFIALPIVAWGIEFYQKFTKSGQYDNWDAVAVVIGGVIVALPTIIQGI